MISNKLTFLFAVSCGAIVANLYYAQTLLAVIGHSIELAPASIGLITMLTQIGYMMGLLLIVPLSDFLENRSLIVFLLIATSLLLFSMAIIKNKFIFFRLLIFTWSYYCSTTYYCSFCNLFVDR